MQVAAAGKSTLGIPKAVGKEFVAADKASPKIKAPPKIGGASKKR